MYRLNEYFTPKIHLNILWLDFAWLVKKTSKCFDFEIWILIFYPRDKDNDYDHLARLKSDYDVPSNEQNLVNFLMNSVLKFISNVKIMRDSNLRSIWRVRWGRAGNLPHQRIYRWHRMSASILQCEWTPEIEQK